MTRQLSLNDLAEFVFHLTQLDSEIFQIAHNSGCLKNCEGTEPHSVVVVVVVVTYLSFYCFIFPSLGALDAN